MIRDRVSAALCFVLGSVVSAAAQSPDVTWPQFRGPDASGVATSAVSPPIEFSATKNQLWKTALPAGIVLRPSGAIASS